MRKGAWLALIAALPACGGGRASAPEAQAVADTTPVAAAPDTTYRPARRGALIARSALPSPLSDEWQAAAGVCGNPPIFMLLGRGDSVDVLVLLRLQPGDSVTGVYPVAPPEDTTAALRTARVGVQRMLLVDRAYRAERGAVEVSRLDRLASGRFDVVLREVTSQDTVRYLGAFEAIQVDSLPAFACEVARSSPPPGVQ